MASLGGMYGSYGNPGNLRGHANIPLSKTQKYLQGDVDYQSTLRNLQRSLTDYQAQQKVQQARAAGDYGYAKNSMGLQRTNDLSDIQNDYAARGILNSGVYGTRLGDYNTQYNNQVGELTRQYNNQLSDFRTSYNNFLRQQQYEKEAARNAAISRRAAKLGLS